MRARNDSSTYSCISSSTGRRSWARFLAQLKVGPSGRGGAGRRGHSSTSSACRRAGSARGSRRASSMSCAGLRPGRASHRRSASQAMSLPSRWRSRTTSTIERSAANRTLAPASGRIASVNGLRARRVQAAGPRESIWHGPVLRPAGVLCERIGGFVKIRDDGESWSKPVPIRHYDSMLSELADPQRAFEVLGLRDRIRSWRFYDQFRTDADAPVRCSATSLRAPCGASAARRRASSLDSALRQSGSWRRPRSRRWRRVSVPRQGQWLILTARGIGSDEVGSEPYVPRSRSREVTYQQDLTDWEEVCAEVTRIAGQVTATCWQSSDPPSGSWSRSDTSRSSPAHTRSAAGGAHQRSGRDRARRRAHPGEVH